MGKREEFKKRVIERCPCDALNEINYQGDKNTSLTVTTVTEAEAVIKGICEGYLEKLEEVLKSNPLTFNEMSCSSDFFSQDCTHGLNGCFFRLKKLFPEADIDREIKRFALTVLKDDRFWKFANQYHESGRYVPKKTKIDGTLDFLKVIGTDQDEIISSMEKVLEEFLG